MPLKIRESISTRIIDELSRAQKFTAEEIRSKVSRKCSCSTAGVYKELNYLLKSGIIVKERKVFALSLPWILSVIQYGQLLQRNFIKQKLLSSYLPSEGKKLRWHFRDLLIMDDFWNQLILTLFAECQDIVMYEWVPRPWFALVHKEKEDSLQRGIRLLKKQVHMIIGGSGFLDRQVTSILSSDVYRLSSATGPFHHMRDTYLDVIDNFILSIHFDRSLTSAIDQFFEAHQSRTALPRPQDFIALIARKNDIILQLENNPLKASRLRKKFKEYFG